MCSTRGHVVPALEELVHLLLIAAEDDARSGERDRRRRPRPGRAPGRRRRTRRRAPGCRGRRRASAGRCRRRRATRSPAATPISSSASATSRTRSRYRLQVTPAPDAEALLAERDAVGASGRERVEQPGSVVASLMRPPPRGRGRPRSPTRPAAPRRRVPSAISWPKSSTTTCSAMLITTAMSCSIRSIVIPNVSWMSRMNRRHVLLLLGRHAGHRLVEEDELRVLDERAPELDALLDPVRAGRARRRCGGARGGAGR